MAATQHKKFALAATALVVAFALPLWKLFRFALGDELFSYIPLIPVASAYLIWQRKKEERGNVLTASLSQSVPVARSRDFMLAAILGLAGLGALAGYFVLFPASAPAENALAFSTLAWLLFLAGAGFWFLGGATMRAIAFPFAFLIFMVPFPVPVRDLVENLLQRGSAEVAQWMFVLAGTPLLRNGMDFSLPGMTIRVAPECSGIHSTLVLFITSLVAGYLILRRPWSRAVLCLAVIPLALLRNGFRVFVIGELCVHIGPEMIDSPIHHRGGPLFFLLSLVPFFLLLYFLRKSETKGAAGLPPKRGEE